MALHCVTRCGCSLAFAIAVVSSTAIGPLSAGAPAPPVSALTRIVIPGHGRPFEGKEAIPAVQGCLRDLWQQAARLETAGVPAREAAGRIDLRAHASRFPQFATVGFNQLAVERIYAVIATRAARAR